MLGSRVPSNSVPTPMSTNHHSSIIQPLGATKQESQVLSLLQSQDTSLCMTPLAKSLQGVTYPGTYQICIFIILTIPEAQGMCHYTASPPMSFQVPTSSCKDAGSSVVSSSTEHEHKRNRLKTEPDSQLGRNSVHSGLSRNFLCDVAKIFELKKLIKISLFIIKCGHYVMNLSVIRFLFNGYHHEMDTLAPPPLIYMRLVYTHKT